MRARRLVLASLCLAGLIVALAAGPAGDRPPLRTGETPRIVHAVGPVEPLVPGVFLAFYEPHCPRAVLLPSDWLGRTAEGLTALWLDPRSESGLEAWFSFALLHVDRLWPAAEMWARLPGQDSARGFVMEVQFARGNVGPASFYVEFRGVGYVVDPAGPIPIALYSGYIMSEDVCL